MALLNFSSLQVLVFMLAAQVSASDLTDRCRRLFSPEPGSSRSSDATERPSWKELIFKLTEQKYDPTGLVEGLDESVRLKLVRWALTQSTYDEVADPYLHIPKYGLSASSRIKLALASARQRPEKTSRKLPAFELALEKERFLVAKVAMREAPEVTSELLPNYGLTNQKYLNALALIAFEVYASGASYYIDVYGLKSQDHLYALALDLASKDGAAMSANIKQFDIQDPLRRFKLAKKAALNDPAETSRLIGNYALQSLPGAHYQVAKIAAGRDGWGVSDQAHRYGLKDPGEIQEIARIAIGQDGPMGPRAVVMALRFHGITVPKKLLKQLEAAAGFADVRDGLALLRRHHLNHLISENEFESLTGPVQRADVLRGLFVTQLVSKLKPVQAGGSSQQELIVRLLGFPDGAIAELKKSSTDTQGVLMATALDTSFRLGWAFFAKTQTDLDLFRRKDLAHLISYLSSVSHLRQLHLDEDKFKASLRMSLREGLDTKNIAAQVSLLREELAAYMTSQFKIGEQSVSCADIERLRQSWGDLEPFTTLLARFQGRVEWQVEIPVLGQVIRHVLEGNFHEFKFRGITPADRQKAQEQVPSDHVEIWSQDRMRLGLLRADEQEITVDHARRRTRQRLYRILYFINQGLKAEAGGFKASDSSPKRFRDLIVTAKEDPKETLKQLEEQAGSRQGVLAALHATIEKYTHDSALRRLIRFLKLVGRELGLSEELRSDIQALDRVLAHVFTKSKEFIVFTTTTADPRLLLTSGSLVETGSCMNYHNGPEVDTLLSDVIDANTLDVIGFALQESHFHDPEDYQIVRRLAESGQTPTARLDFRTVAYFEVEGRIIQTRPLKKGFLKYVLRYGKGSSPYVYLDRESRQTHFAQDLMQAHVYEIKSELEAALGAKAKNKSGKTHVTFGASRNPRGTYTELGGRRTGVIEATFPSY